MYYCCTVYCIYMKIRHTVAKAGEKCGWYCIFTFCSSPGLKVLTVTVTANLAPKTQIFMTVICTQERIEPPTHRTHRTHKYTVTVTVTVIELCL
jgi:hypothetical protein